MAVSKHSVLKQLCVLSLKYSLSIVITYAISIFSLCLHASIDAGNDFFIFR